MIIAIDGPAASGKSTVARALARRLGFGYLDTGAMYRAIALAALQTKTPLDDAAALTALATSVVIRLEPGADPGYGGRVLLDDVDVTTAIRSPEVDGSVSAVARVAGVRDAMVSLQRTAGANGDFVVEGRDIGSVVFPDARVKVFLDASAEERARRRTVDMDMMGVDMGEQDVMQRLIERDRKDSERSVSPLSVADDARVLDTTGMSIDAVVEHIAALAEA